MASITMDTSEYEALKKNITLLEEGKLKEESLQIQIQKLKDEKIQILEQSANSVVIINKNIVEEYIYENRPVDDVVRLLNGTNLNSGVFASRFEQIADLFFKKIKNTTSEVVSTEIKGLEEYKKEMKTQYYNDLDNEIKTKLEMNSHNIKLVSTLKMEVYDNKININRLKNEKEDLEIITNNNEREIRGLKSTISTVKGILKKKWNIFNYLTFKHDLLYEVSNTSKGIPYIK